MKKRNINIQIVRIVSMFLILFCHFKLPFNLGNLLDVGVYIFLIISGYLYGQKEIKDFKKWFKRKFFQICIPIYLWLIVVNILNIITNNDINYFNNLYYILNIQAIVGFILGIEHLWFITIIMFSYLITPLLYKIKNSDENKKKMLLLIFAIIIIFVLTSFINDKLARYIFYASLYIISFFYSSFNQLKKDNKLLTQIKYFTLIVVAGLCRLISKKYLDDTLIYSNFLVLATHTVIAISIFKIIMNIKFKRIPERIINYLDGISYYVYIVHYIFCVGPVMIIKDFSKMWPIQVIITICLSFLIATILKIITDKITKKLNSY